MTEIDVEQFVSGVARDVATLACAPGRHLAANMGSLHEIQDQVALAIQKGERTAERAERLRA